MEEWTSKWLYVTAGPFLTGCLHHSFQDDHDLKVFLLQLGLRHVPEGGVCINLMGNDQWGDQEETVVTCLKAHADVCLVQRDELAWWTRHMSRRLSESFAFSWCFCTDWHRILPFLIIYKQLNTKRKRKKNTLRSFFILSVSRRGYCHHISIGSVV